MKRLASSIFLLAILSPVTSNAETVITCGQAISIKGEARLVLHDVAQKRAQAAVEEFMERPLNQKYVDPFGTECLNGKCSDMVNLKSTADWVESYWCTDNSMPLHSAYYSLYTSSKSFFK